MKYRTKLTFQIYAKHAGKYPLALFVMAMAVVGGSIMNIFGPIYYAQFFEIVFAADDPMAVVGALRGIIINILVVYIIGFTLWRIAAFVNSHFQTRVMADLANTCFGYLHKHSVSFFNNSFVGSLVKRVNRFYRSFEGLADIITWELGPLVIEVAAMIFVVWQQNVQIAVGILIWAIIYCVINYVFSIYKLPYDVKKANQETKTTGVLADTITNHANIKLFTGYSREVERFGVETDTLRRMRRFTWDLGNIFETIQIVLMIILEFFVFYIAIDLWADGLIGIGLFVLLQAYLLRIFHKLWDFGKIIRRYYEIIADAEEMTEILDEPHEIVDVKRAKKLEVAGGAITFDQVDFAYHKTRKVINGMKLKIKGGERVALVGPSGAGKSTIVKLLLRQHDVTRGKIMIDKQVIGKVTLESLRSNVSMVPQDPILFHRTLLDNIRYGKPDAADEEVVEAAKLAHCHEFISDFPEQYETLVGERGVKLSGGERQRVAIARAILRNAPVLILDEATSSLDSESEMLIQDALENLMKGKTVLVIAHRLSTIMKMDRILVIDAGKVIEQGTHDELLKQKNGMYKQLWDLQSGGFLE